MTTEGKVIAILIECGNCGLVYQDEAPEFDYGYKTFE